MAQHKLIKVEVAYALPTVQRIVTLEVPEGTTVFEAAERSNITACFDGLDLANIPLGIFGKVVKKPREELIREGQRVEIYRPLTIDPKVARANRAAKAAEKKKEAAANQN